MAVDTEEGERVVALLAADVRLEFLLLPCAVIPAQLTQALSFTCVYMQQV